MQKYGSWYTQEDFIHGVGKSHPIKKQTKAISSTKNIKNAFVSQQETGQ